MSREVDSFPALFDYVRSPVVQIATFRRRRARARRPAAAASRPGSPAPTIGPGTAEMFSVESALPAPVETMEMTWVTA